MSHGPAAPVTICQIEAEFGPLLNMYKSVRPRRVLEIGTASGGTLYHWLTNAAPGAVVVSVDYEQPAYVIDRDQCLGWAPAGVRCVLICGDSRDEDTAALARDWGPFDWLFIDGDHAYTTVRRDFLTYAAMCRHGAHVVFHDIALIRETAGVSRLWRELQASGYWTLEFRAHPAQYGIGVLRLDYPLFEASL